MSNHTRRVPAIRFSGFTDDWEQRKLGELAEIIGGGTPSTRNVDFWDGEIDWYTPAEISNQIYVNRSIRQITELGLANSSAKLLPRGTVLFTSRAGIGKTAILDRAASTNQGFQSIVPRPNLLDPYFIFSRSDELKRYGEVVGAGSTFVEVSGKQMAAMLINMPSLIKEQKRIASVFALLDNLITLHQRKLDLLKKQKQTLLSKMFPKNGEKVPEFRFSGFTDDWEQRKLGEIAIELIAGGDIDKELLDQEGTYPVYANSLVDGGLIGYYKDRFRVEAPAVTITGRGDIGTAVPRFVNFTPVVRLISIRTNYDAVFIANNLNTTKFLVESTGVPQLTVPQAARKVLWVPLNREESTKNGKLFALLDHLITLHQRKLDTLKSLKKSLLKEMFI